MRFWINKYHPLAESDGGIEAAKRAREPLFVDASHRREPYLSQELATISSICRGMQFAPRLEIGDVVVYLTTKARYLGEMRESNRLTAVLKIVERFESHGDAATWLRKKQFPVPPNCFARRSRGLDEDYCAPCSPSTRLDAEARYKRRVERYPMYFVCRPLWINLDCPPSLSGQMIRKALGRDIPRTPITWRRSKIRALLALVELDLDGL